MRGITDIFDHIQAVRTMTCLGRQDQDVHCFVGQVNDIRKKWRWGRHNENPNNSRRSASTIVIILWWQRKDPRPSFAEHLKDTAQRN